MIELEQVVVTQREFQLNIRRLRLPVGLTLLVGRNGAGKSTLLRLLATAIEPSAGTVKYGRTTTDESLSLIRSQIGYVPTGLELYEEMSVRKLLHYLSELKGVRDPKELDRLIEMLQIEDDQAKIKQLSEGNRQKVAIAQAFMGSPYLLLLDEPLNALDSRERKLVTRALIQYARSHIVVVATHEINEWMDQMDRILWMGGGDVQFFGTREQWMNIQPLQVWEGIVHLNEEIPASRILHIRELPDGQEVRIASADRPGESYRRAEPTAEEVYLIRQWGLT